MTFTAEQVDAARALRAANLNLDDVIHQEPRTDSPAYMRWRDRWEGAYLRHEDAEDAYRRLFPGVVAPPARLLLTAGTVNPLRPTSDPNIWHTLDRAFVTAPTKAGGWILDWYGLPSTFNEVSHVALPLRVRDLTGAQELVDWIGWASTTGLRSATEWDLEEMRRETRRRRTLTNA